jgi:copper chaperone NosL
MKRLHPATRILLVLGLIAMAYAWSQPAWQIRLWAPQYPEGLAMQIWLDNITGDVDVINGLNHYIGMREIEVATFPEFKFMKGLLVALIAIGALPVLTGRRPFLWLFVITLFAAAFAGLADFWYWSREFGNNLDPKAAISVPGMSYDPPLIGYKVILNFVAYSAPAIGGYLLIGAGTLASALLAWELWRGRSGKTKTAPLLAMLPLFLVFPACERSSRPIDFGNEDCAECNMTLVDKRYGTQYVTGKGKIFTFDDVNCLVEYILREPAASDDKPLYYVIDFNRPGEFIDATKAVYLHHKKLRSPMRADAAAFIDLSSAQAAMKELGEEGKILNWEEVKTMFKPD